jgi:CDP-diacylglycerol--glycerol-3-phosphate 3-phosphatidyltransferase
MHSNLTIPNIISSCRIALAPVLAICIIFGREELFAWLLLFALLSDIADGIIARTFNLQTKLGATLDSLGDMGTYLAAVAGIFVFQMEFVQTHWIELVIILSFYILEKVKGFVAYGRPFNAFHTYLSKSTAYFQGAFVLSLFFWGFQWFLFYPSMTLCITANVEEMILSSVLRTHASDVKGLFWVLKERKTA